MVCAVVCATVCAVAVSQSSMAVCHMWPTQGVNKQLQEETASSDCSLPCAGLDEILVAWRESRFDSKVP